MQLGLYAPRVDLYAVLSFRGRPGFSGAKAPSSCFTTASDSLRTNATPMRSSSLFLISNPAFKHAFLTSLSAAYSISGMVKLSRTSLAFFTFSIGSTFGLMTALGWLDFAASFAVTGFTEAGFAAAGFIATFFALIGNFFTAVAVAGDFAGVLAGFLAADFAGVLTTDLRAADDAIGIPLDFINRINNIVYLIAQGKYEQLNNT